MEEAKDVYFNYNFWLAQAMRKMIEDKVEDKSIHTSIAQKVLKKTWKLEADLDCSMETLVKMASIKKAYFNEDLEVQELLDECANETLQEWSSGHAWKPNNNRALTTAKTMEARLKFFDCNTSVITLTLLRTLQCTQLFFLQKKV